MRKQRDQLQIFSLINGLTNDEDFRQDLWVCYLSGEPSAALSTRLDEIKLENEIGERLKHTLWQLHKNPPSTEFQQLLNNFSELEQSVMLLMLLDLSVTEVSEYKGISLVRTRQIITAIKSDPVWEDIWHLKETLTTKNDTD